MSTPRFFETFLAQNLPDSNFIHATAVDLLLGANVYTELMLSVPNNFITDTPSAISTAIGMLFFGKLFFYSTKPIASLITTTMKIILPVIGEK